MSTLTTILSFPFWFFGIAFMFASIFANNVRVNGQAVYGKTALIVKSAVFFIGVTISTIAYILVMI
jgi:hypothetical protein